VQRDRDRCLHRALTETVLDRILHELVQYQRDAWYAMIQNVGPLDAHLGILERGETRHSAEDLALKYALGDMLDAR